MFLKVLTYHVTRLWRGPSVIPQRHNVSTINEPWQSQGQTDSATELYNYIDKLNESLLHIIIGNCLRSCFVTLMSYELLNMTHNIYTCRKLSIKCICDILHQQRFGLLHPSSSFVRVHALSMLNRYRALSRSCPIVDCKSFLTRAGLLDDRSSLQHEAQVGLYLECHINIWEGVR